MTDTQERRNQPLGGIQYPAANLEQDNYLPPPGYTLVWEDDFSEETLNTSRWSRQVEPAGRFNDEWQRYTDSDDNAYIDRGCLVIRARHESQKHGPDQYTSARLHTAAKGEWRYGRFAARIQLPFGAGTWPAFWMLGANIDENGGDTPWPDSGEIDVMEFYGSRNNGAIEVNIHYADAKGQHVSMGATPWALDKGWLSEAFHVFEIEWDDEGITWLVDGTIVHHTSLSGDVHAAFHRPFFVLLNLAIGGKWSGRPDHSTIFPQVMYVDWVRVYQSNSP